jgi:hypothetical protein
VSKPKARYKIKRRYWDDAQIADRMGVSLTYFQKNKFRYYKAGMPQPDTLMGGTDKKALELWFDSRSGLIDASTKDGRHFDRSAMAVGEHYGQADG